MDASFADDEGVEKWSRSLATILDFLAEHGYSGVAPALKYASELEPKDYVLLANILQRRTLSL